MFNLQGKRGIEKQPFQLPDFIAATGIEKIRQVFFVNSPNFWRGQGILTFREILYLFSR